MTLKDFLRGKVEDAKAIMRRARRDHHDYTSTACHHGLHERCMKTCKFCATPCRCACHEQREARRPMSPEEIFDKYGVYLPTCKLNEFMEDLGVRNVDSSEWYAPPPQGCETPHRFEPVKDNPYCGQCGAGKLHSIHFPPEAA